MAGNQTVNEDTQFGVCNGNTEGYASAADVAAELAGHILGEDGVSTAAPISGNGTDEPLTVTDEDLATALEGELACAAIQACVANADAATEDQIDAIDENTQLLMKIGDDLVCVTAGDLGWGDEGGSGGTSETPFSDGQNADDWRFNLSGGALGTSGTLPAGPTANGYWHIEVSGDGTTVFTPGTTETAGNDVHGIAGSEATYSYTPTPGGGGSLDGIRGHWVSL